MHRKRLMMVVTLSLAFFFLNTGTASSAGSATRDLPDCYTPGVALTVTISVTPAVTVNVHAVEDASPAGWTVGSINESGNWDNVNKKVKWGPFFDHNARTLSYQATPPGGESGTKTFSGTASFDGANVTVGGETGVGACGVSETVSTPSVPSGPGSGVAGTSYSYTTGGSVSSLGHTVEYRFDWKGDESDLSSWGSATQSKTWSNPGNYNVKARARCTIHQSILSDWSSGSSVSIVCSIPGTPYNPSPSNGSQGEEISHTLNWSSGQAVSYDVYFGTTSPPPLVTTVTSATYQPGPLLYGTTYYWKVVAKNGCGEVSGPAWSFKTCSLSISPKEGTLGTVITIDGPNFGASKNKVFVDVVSLKISNWNNGQIQALLGKSMEPGKYDVRVQPKVPKNTPPVVEGGGFSVKGPEITSAPQGGSAGETIKMEGKFFTTQKGKVTLDYYVSGGLKRKSCKILSWTMDSKNGTGGIEFVVPKGLVSGGDYTLTVTNKVGFVQSGFSIH